MRETSAVSISPINYSVTSNIIVNYESKLNDNVCKKRHTGKTIQNFRAKKLSKNFCLGILYARVSRNLLDRNASAEAQLFTKILSTHTINVICDKDLRKQLENISATREGLPSIFCICVLPIMIICCNLLN